ncbi:MAG: hypothetical protein ACI9FB_003908 [Candidatus Azotimanducaceae bacterium]
MPSNLPFCAHCRTVMGDTINNSATSLGVTTLSYSFFIYHSLLDSRSQFSSKYKKMLQKV